MSLEILLRSSLHTHNTHTEQCRHTSGDGWCLNNQTGVYIWIFRTRTHHPKFIPNNTHPSSRRKSLYISSNSHTLITFRFLRKWFCKSTTRSVGLWCAHTLSLPILHNRLTTPIYMYVCTGEKTHPINRDKYGDMCVCICGVCKDYLVCYLCNRIAPHRPKTNMQTQRRVMMQTEI